MGAEMAELRQFCAEWDAMVDAEIDGHPQFATGRDFAFRPSFLLGDRAPWLYQVFICSLTLPGDVAECGVAHGETSREMVRFLERSGYQKRVHMFDTFAGFPDVLTDEERALDRDDAPAWLQYRVGALAWSLDEVLQRFDGLSQYEAYPGLFSETFPAFDRPLCFIHADADLYQSTVEIVELADRVLVPGGRIVFDDYLDGRFPGVMKAVHERLDFERYAFGWIEDTMQGFAIKNDGGM